MSKILVVDDAETQRFQLKKDLEAAGYEVVEAHDGLDGLKVIDLNPDISLVICDVNMPIMDGLTMCSKVKETGKLQGVPIFMLTTEASAEMKQTAKQFGVRAWITKPFVAIKLIEAVGKVVKK
jgi:two-component system chemotaxis response regulator CheY